MQRVESMNEAWRPFKKFAFRFVFIFMSIYSGFTISSIIYSKGAAAFWDWLVNGISVYVLHLDYVTSGPTGSGDTTGDYIWMLFLIVSSVWGSLVWTLFDRKRAHYRPLSEGLMVVTRYLLAFILMSYGFGKVFELQFQFPGFRRLLQRFGDASPMGLAWTFMGYSPGYNWFAGGLEALGGLLLFHRRTTSLGAIITLGVMGNIVMMNLCFDIPVKLYSSLYLFMAIGLLFPDMKRLLSVLLTNRATEARAFKPYFSSKRWLWVSWAIKTLLVGWLCYSTINSAVQGQKQWGKGRAKHALYGLYRVETYIKDGEEIPPLITDKQRFHYIFFEYDGLFGFQMMDGAIAVRRAETDVEGKVIKMNPSRENPVEWRYEQPDPDTLTFEVESKDGHVIIHAKRESRDQFLLVNRGFHWINEYPYNR